MTEFNRFGAEITQHDKDVDTLRMMLQDAGLGGWVAPLTRLEFALCGPKEEKK